MNKESYNVIGVMSGTSLDGVDLAHIHFDIKNQQWDFQIIECETIGYNQEWLEQLKIAVGFSDPALPKLNSASTLLFGHLIFSFIKKLKI